MTEIKHFIDIPFDQKEKAKQNNYSWDADLKRWFTFNSDCKLLDEYECVTLLNFIFDKKDFIKSNGGKYNPNTKTWHTYKSNSKLQEFM